MTEIRLGIRENVRHLNGKRILQLPGEGFAKIRAPDAGFFLPKCWEVGKYTFERQMRINQADVKCCLLSNQTIVCLVSLFIFAFGNERRIRESDRQKKKTRDAGFSTKIYPQIGDLNPVWNQIIWRSPWSLITQLLQVTTLVTFFFLFFFFFFLQKTCFNALHLQAVQRRLKEMRVRMAEDLCQRIVNAEAK